MQAQHQRSGELLMDQAQDAVFINEEERRQLLIKAIFEVDLNTNNGG